MFGKLIKYDFKMVLEKCIPLYAIAFILALTNGGLIRFGTGKYFQTIELNSTLDQIFSIIYGIFATGSIFMIAAIIPICGVLIIARFYKGVFDKEGYLTNTLPVTCHQIIGSKFLTGFTSILVSGFVLLLAGAIFAFIVEPTVFQNIVDFYSKYAKEIPISLILTIIVTGLSQLIVAFMQIYLSIAMGHLCKHRVLASIVAYFGIQYFVSQPLALIAMLATGNGQVQVGTEYDVFASMNSFLIFACILNLVLAATYYFFTAFIMKKKLNLQ